MMKYKVQQKTMYIDFKSHLWLFKNILSEINLFPRLLRYFFKSACWENLFNLFDQVRSAEFTTKMNFYRDKISAGDLFQLAVKYRFAMFQS